MCQRKLINSAWPLAMLTDRSWISLILTSHLFQIGPKRRHLWLYITKLPSKTWPTRISPTKPYLEIAAATQKHGLVDINTRSASNIFQATMVTSLDSFRKMFMQNLLRSALRRQLDKECLRAMKLFQRFVSCQLNAPNTPTKIIVASVSIINRYVSFCIVDNPDFRPLPDYVDYTKFVNNEYPK